MAVQAPASAAAEDVAIGDDDDADDTESVRSIRVGGDVERT